jgi:Peptidase family M28
MAARMVLVAIVLLLAVAGFGYGALHYMTAVPGQPHSGALKPLTADETALAAALKRHIATIAAREHNVAHYDELEKVARYIEATLESFGYTVGRQEFTAERKLVRNIDVTIEPPAAQPDPEVVVVGAHYDSARGSPGANDNATGAAAVLELARLLRDLAGTSGKRIRLVLFVNEEPPYFQTEAMGSLRYARALAERNERVVAMYSLETIGFYSSEPGSQRYPAPFGMVFPDRGDFVAFVGMLGSRPLLQETIRSFRSHTSFPTIGGVAPRAVPGIGWSDHWAFAEHGFQAVMITDTALFRYPHYHQPTDTPDKIDTEKLARVVKGIERVIRDLTTADGRRMDDRGT